MQYVTIEEIILEYIDLLSHFLMKGSIIVIITIHNNETNFAFSNKNIVKCNVLRNIIFLKQNHFNVKG